MWENGAGGFHSHPRPAGGYSRSVLAVWLAWSFVAAAEPELPPAAPALLEAALGAKARGDQAELTWCMQAWATLGEGTAPAELSAEAKGAAEWAAARGRFRMFGSRLPDRIRVGIEDPAGAVGRVIVTIREGASERRLVQAEESAPDRMEFHLGGELGPGAEVQIDALLTRLGGEQLIRRALIASLEAAPTPPSPAKPARLKARRGAEPEASSTPWWWIGAAIAAAALTGAAVWQETRFR
jgi:hypothetical protein